MQEREQAIEKVQKLLRLSTSSYEAEARVALQKARELMLRYHLDELAVTGGEVKENVVCEALDVKEFMINTYALIARNTRCDVYHSHRCNEYGKRVHVINLVGFKFDVECVKVMGEFAQVAIENGLREFRRKVKSGETVMINGDEYETEYEYSTKGLKDFYVNGFESGITRAFAEQNAEQEYHLMVVTPSEVKEHMESLDFKGTYHGKNRNQQTMNRNSRLAYAIGYYSGKDIGKRRGITEGCEN